MALEIAFISWTGGADWEPAKASDERTYWEDNQEWDVWLG